MNRTDRLFAILLQLQTHGRLRARDLAADFEVSVRTIYRDVEALCQSGVPIIALPGQGYSLQEGYFLPPLMFTTLEAGALSLGADYVAQTLDAPLRAAAESAQAKLANALTAESRRDLQHLQDSVRYLQIDSAPAHPHLRTVREAILARTVLRITYHAYGRPAPADRDVEPYGLIHTARAWQLLAHCRTRRAPRMFRLDRIDAVHPTGEHFHHRPGLTARTARPPTDEPRTLARIRADAAAARWIREDHPHGLIGEEDHDDHTILTFAVRDLARLGRWLLQWGDAVDILDPPHLRHHLAEQGRRIAHRHAGDVHHGGTETRRAHGDRQEHEPVEAER